MVVTDRYIATDTIRSELVYFVEDDDSNDVALQGDRGHFGIKDVTGDSFFNFFINNIF